MIETSNASLGGESLTVRIIARFQLPLMFNAWLMALVGPMLNVALARSQEPRLQLAAFWLAFSVLLLAQSACLVMQQSSAAALRRHVGLPGIAKAAVVLGVVASAMVWVAGATPLGDVLFRDVLPTAPRTAELARAVLLAFVPLPLLVAVRGMAAGVAAVERRTEFLTVATTARLLVLVVTGVAVAASSAGMDAVAAAKVMAWGATAEALVMGALVCRVSRTGTALKGSGSMTPMLRVALPLATASLVWCAVRPLIGAILGRLTNPELAQAAFGVLLPLLIFSCAPLWSFLEAAVVLPRDGADVKHLLRVALLTSTGFATALAILAWSPLRSAVLHSAFGLTPELERNVTPALALLAFEPLLLSARAIAQGLLLRAGRQELILALAPVKLVVVALAGFAVARAWPQANGAVLGLGLILGGDLVDLGLYGVSVARTGAYRPDEAGSLPPRADVWDPLREAA